MGEPVYVGAISDVPDADFRDDFAAANGEWNAYQETHTGRRYRRRFPMWDAYLQQTKDDEENLGIIGGKMKYYDGCIRIDGIERRFAEHDYRLLVERGIIPRDTVLIAGIVFWVLKLWRLRSRRQRHAWTTRARTCGNLVVHVT